MWGGEKPPFWGARGFFIPYSRGGALGSTEIFPPRRAFQLCKGRGGFKKPRREERGGGVRGRTHLFSRGNEEGGLGGGAGHKGGREPPFFLDTRRLLVGHFWGGEGRKSYYSSGGEKKTPCCVNSPCVVTSRGAGGVRRDFYAPHGCVCGDTCESKENTVAELL